MARLSARTVTTLGRVLTGWSVKEIDSLFRDGGVRLGPEVDDSDTSVRRAQMRRYLSTLDPDSPSDQRLLAGVFTEVLRDAGDDVRRELGGRLRADGFLVDEGTWHVSVHTATLAEAALSELTDPGALHDALQRIASTVEQDPRAAVSAAKSLIESTAKIVLRERKVEFSSADKVPTLVTRAQQSLSLHAGSVSPEDKAANAALVKVLGALSQMAVGVTELRNKVGVDHGRESVPTWVRPRHARLAANAAQAWCSFVLETLNDQQAPWRNAGSD